MKYNKNAVIAVVSAFMLLCAMQISAAAKTYYIAPDGNDSNAGTAEAPLASLHGVRQLHSSGDAEVIVRGGTYYTTESFELTDKHANESKRWTIRAAEGEKPVIKGGILINKSDFEPVDDVGVLAKLPDEAKDYVMQVDLKKYGILSLPEVPSYGYGRDIREGEYMLYADGQPMTIAKWPNKGTMPIGHPFDRGVSSMKIADPNSTGYITVPDDRIKRWGTANDAYIAGYLSDENIHDVIKVRKADVDLQRVIPALQHMKEMYSAYEWNRFTIFNLIEELDTPGEFYIDRTRMMLYYYPASDADLMLSYLKDPIIALKGTINVTISGISFEETRGMGIYIERGQNNVIENCTLKNIGTVGINIGEGAITNSAVSLSRSSGLASGNVGNLFALLSAEHNINRLGGRNHRITGCEVGYTGAGGIFVGAGNREALTESNILIDNNVIHDVNMRVRNNVPAVWIDGVGTTVKNNTIYNTSEAALQVYGSLHTVDSNIIENVCLDNSTLGAIYVAPDITFWGNNFTNNYIANYGGYGIYLDDMVSGQKVLGNVFYHTGRGTGALYLKNGQYNEFSANQIINADSAASVTLLPLDGTGTWFETVANTANSAKLDAVKYNASAYKTKFPQLQGIKVTIPIETNKFSNNVLVNSGDWSISYVPSEMDADSSGIYEYGTAYKDASQLEKINGMWTLSEGKFAKTANAVGSSLENDSNMPHMISHNSVLLKVGETEAFVKEEEHQIDESGQIAPIIVNNRTLVPLRFVAEAFNAEVEYVENTKQIFIAGRGRRAEFAIGSQQYNEKGKPGYLEAAPAIMHDRTMVPLRAVSEALGLAVAYQDGVIAITDKPAILQDMTEEVLVDCWRMNNDNADIGGGNID